MAPSDANFSVQSIAWHSLSVDQALQKLHVDVAAGLSSDEARHRLDSHGANELVETGQRSPWRILWEQLTGAMVLLLVGAAVVSLFLQEYIDATAILTIIVLNAVLGFVQDYRAERALAALRKLSVPVVRVRRDNATTELPAIKLVPGDVILLEAGSAVPADCRLTEIFALKAQEAAMTGESEPVEKTVEPLSNDVRAVADQTNMVWMGTTVTYGHGTAIVVQTGMSTQLGHIASSLQTVESEPTPLQQRLARLGRVLAVVALLIVAVVFVFGLLRGEDPKLMLLTALSLAVAVVPEGLPAVATVSLAIGARRMVQREALIRKLPAVETLGSVNVICTDKTGTLTENRMTVTVLDVAGRQVDLETGNTGSTPPSSSLPEEDSSLPLLLMAGSLCNDSELQSTNNDEGDTDWQALGDPTEAALVIVAARQGLLQADLKRALPRVGEVPFNSERKKMTTLHERREGVSVSESVRSHVQSLWKLIDTDNVAFTKGAVDRIIDSCTCAWSENAPMKLTDDWRQRINTASDELASNGMRVLGFAMHPVNSTPSDDVPDSVEQDLIFLGLMGMIDPPRSEVRDAVARCRDAGIRPVMITGDHPLTALYIAQQLGIADDDSTVLTGHDLQDREAVDLEPVVESTSVYARVSPRDKLNIVRALQNRGHVVAMTGDGVNDAPALKQAHIGVAMGIVGTDVSKEASDMVLLDDNFATIVNAVEQGRIVYDNIRKFVKYTMTSNAGEVGVMLLGPLLGMPLALLPLQILWINLVTDGLPGLALALEPAERNTMKRPPFSLNEHVINRRMVIDIAWIGVLMAVVSLSLGYWCWSTTTAPAAHWRTMVFTVLTMSQMGNALATRSENDSLFTIGIFSNRPLLGAILLTFVLQLAVIYLPVMQRVFQTVSLNVSELSACLLLSTVVFFAVELRKWFSRKMTV